MDRVLAIIPARGGSKGIKRKNLSLLAGKTLIEHAIESAKKCNHISRLILSTDSEEIAEEGRRLGCLVPFIRPKELANDSASSHSVVRHALLWMEKNEMVTYDYGVLLQPTTPFRKSEWIDACIKRVYQGDVDSVVTITGVGGNHPHRMYSFRDNLDQIKPIVDEVLDPMAPRQGLPEVFIRSGDVYVTTRECIVSKGSLLGARTAGVVVEGENIINIDTQNDLELARIIAGDYSKAI